MQAILSKSSIEISDAVILMTRQALLDTELVYNGKRWRTRELAPLFTRLRNQINAMVFGFNDQSVRNPRGLYSEQSVMMNICEANNFIGWQSGQVHFSLQFVQYICEGMSPPKGQAVAFLLHLQRFMDMQFQTRLAFSLYFHSPHSNDI